MSDWMTNISVNTEGLPPIEDRIADLRQMWATGVWPEGARERWVDQYREASWQPEVWTTIHERFLLIEYIQYLEQERDRAYDRGYSDATAALS